MGREGSGRRYPLVPLEVIAARALARAVKRWSLKGYLERTYKRLKVPDSARPVVTGLIAGTARNWMLLSKALGFPYHKPPSSTGSWLKLVLAYQSLIRRTPPSKVEWAFKVFPKETYLELLRSEPEDFLRDLPPEERDRVRLSVPKWAWQDIKEVTDPVAFVKALDERKGFWVRVRDPSVITELEGTFQIERGPFEDSLYLIGPKRELIRRGLHPNKLVIMELASMTIAHVAKGKRALDLTAAPGGKALHLADRGFYVVANDVDPTRFYFKLERVVGDATRPPYRKGFDTIVLDPDCSSIGRLNSPETRVLLPLIDKRKLSSYQEKLLRGALEIVRKGSRLIYSTCTITYEENEAHSNLIEGSCEPVDLEVGVPGRRKGWRRYLPNLHGTIGFTFGVFEC